VEKLYDEQFFEIQKNAITARINNMPAGKKIALAISVPMFFLAVLSLTAFIAIESMSVIRAYVGGEGLYSKYGKDAVIYLYKYKDSHNEQDYLVFVESIQVPLAMGRARLELEKPNADIEVACQALIQGHNHPKDVKGAAYLFRLSRYIKIDYFEKIKALWAEADLYIVELRKSGNTLHEIISKGQVNEKPLQPLINQTTKRSCC